MATHDWIPILLPVDLAKLIDSYTTFDRTELLYIWKDRLSVVPGFMEGMH